MTKRMFLFHWNEAEGDRLAAAFKAKGWDVRLEHADGARGGKAVLANPPDVVVIYLTRLPSHGRETAHGLRSYKAGKTVPIVFVGGDAAKVAKVREKVPDGIFTDEARLDAVLARVTATPKKGQASKRTAGATRSV